MGEYTIDIRHLLQRGYKLSLDSYPIWSEEYRPYLNQKITDHFMFREIGQETPDRFNFFLQRKMNEIMPYYNKLYESELIQFDPLATEFFKEGTEFKRSRDYESSSKNNGRRGETVGEVFSRNEDNKQDTTFGQVSVENAKGTYTKQGDKTVDTVSKKNEDFNEDKTSKTEQDLNQDKSYGKTEDFTQDTDGHTTVTTDMNEHEVSTVKFNGNTKKVGSQDTVFSDIPQAGIETTRTVAPDGTVTTTTKGYATTTTNVDTTENTTETDTTNTDRSTDTTGTVKTDTTEKVTNNNKTDVTENVKNDNTIDLTENTTNDNVTDYTENQQTNWHETGNDTADTDYKNDELTNVKTNTKEDSERNTSSTVKNSNNHSERSKTGENTNEIFTGKGRKGVSPAELIVKYRDSLINIDMMVIDELETLFMGVY